MKTLIGASKINEAVKRLGVEISENCQADELYIVGILNGSVIFMADLVREITVPCVLDFMQVSSYGEDTVSSGEIVIKRDTEGGLNGRDVLIVEDIVDSGRTLLALKEHLRGKGAKSVRSCTLLDKPSCRVVDVKADYVGMEIEDHFVVGYGLDYAGRYRNLKDIMILEEQ